MVKFPPKENSLIPMTQMSKPLSKDKKSKKKLSLSHQSEPSTAREMPTTINLVK
jgi:hypothetical protein